MESARREDECIAVAVDAEILRCDSVQRPGFVVGAERFGSGAVDADRLGYTVQCAGEYRARLVIDVRQGEREGAARGSPAQSNRTDRYRPVRADPRTAKAVRDGIAGHFQNGRFTDRWDQILRVADRHIRRGGVAFA